MIDSLAETFIDTVKETAALANDIVKSGNLCFKQTQKPSLKN
jgi:hypothetical protein